MKILLTGSRGQMGKEIIRYFNCFLKSSSIELIQTTRSEFNLTEHEMCSKFIQQNKPDFIINAAAYTAVDKAEEEFNIAENINGTSLFVISNSLRETGGKLLHLSSDYVFDGTHNQPYLPNHIRNPINNYGKSKVIGEKAIEEILFPVEQGYILRTSWLIGPVGNNFALTILNLLNQKKELRVISDQIGNPTTTNSLATICWSIILNLAANKKLPNIMHWSDSGVASWYDVAIAVSEIGFEMGLTSGLSYIKPVLTEEYKTIAKRPYYSILNCKETENSLNIKQTYWRTKLREVLQYRKQILEFGQNFK